MKRYNALLLAFALIILSSCKENEWVSIDSLQVFGDEFYQGATVNLGMSVQTSDPDKNYYEWFCDEGSLREAQQGYTVMKWTAPRKNGLFTVGCTVHCGGKKETRTVQIRVSGIFYDRFPGATLSGWNRTNCDAFIRVGRMEAYVSATNTTDSLGYVTKGMSTSNFFPPASVTASVGIVGGAVNNFKPQYPVTASADHPLWDNFMGFGVTGSDPGSSISPTYYISEMRLDWWPTDRMQASTRYYGPADDPYLEEAPRTINAADYNFRVAVQWTRRQDIAENIETHSGWFMVYGKSDDFTHGVDETKLIGLSIDEDYTVNVAVDENTVFTTDVLQIWRQTHPDCEIKLNQVRYTFPSLTRVYMNSVVGNNDTEFIY